MTLVVGARLGTYEIQSALGAGGMGAVYRARDGRLDRTVAIKVPSESLAADPQFRERFVREVLAKDPNQRWQSAIDLSIRAATRGGTRTWCLLGAHPRSVFRS